MTCLAGILTMPSRLASSGENKKENIDCLPGDVNGDGQVDLIDVILLARYLAGWDVVIDEVAADVYRDGELNLKDVVILRRFLAGWDVTLQ